jgi:hypothetical protein
MQDDNSPLTEETEEAILKSLTDAVFEANHLTIQLESDDEKKSYKHFAVLLGEHPLERDLALSVDTPIEHQIQLIRRIHSDLDHGAKIALTKIEAKPEEVLNELLLKMDELPASMRVLGELSNLPDQFKSHLIYSLIGFFAASATKGEYKRPVETLVQLAKLKGVDVSTFLEQNNAVIESLKAINDRQLVDTAIHEALDSGQ